MSGPDPQLDSLRQKLQSDATNLVKGVSNDDVDWFLRGSIKSSKDCLTAHEDLNNHATTALNQQLSTLVQKDGVHHSPKALASLGETNEVNINGVLNKGQPLGRKRASSVHDPNYLNTNIGSSDLRRTRSYSVSTHNNNNASSGGFFSKISSKFSRRNKTPSSIGISRLPSVVSTSSPATTSLHVFEDRPSSPIARRRGSVAPISNRSSLSEDPGINKLTRSRTDNTVDISDDALDPRFEKFLEYYNKNGLAKLSKWSNTSNEQSSNDKAAELPRGRGLSRLLSRTKNESPESPKETQLLEKLSVDDEKNPKVDALGRPIPSLPPVAPLPPAIKIPHAKKQNLHETAENSSPKPSGLFGSFLKRHQSTVDSSLSSVTNDLASNTTRNASRVGSRNSFSSNSSSASVGSYEDSGSSVSDLPGFNDLPVLKRVSFSEKVFFNDPPQQIASRNPRKGEVEILKNGSIVIHKLSNEERQKILQQGGGGVVVGGFGHLRPLSNEEESQRNRSSPPPSPEKEVVTKNPEETSGSTDKNLTPEEKEQEEKDANDPSFAKAKKISIDKPMITRNRSTASLLNGDVDEQADDIGLDGGSSESINKLMNKKVPLDVLYTRCCHLREILPIKSTLKQIPKDSTAPLANLTFRNPLPSLVEIITFSDFISIAPIVAITIDGVSLSFEMFRTLLASLVFKTDLEKITFRNTVIDERGWKLLCWFLIKNKSLKSLDMTQCESLVVLKPNRGKKTKPPSAAIASIVRMKANKADRSDMDWSLFVASLMCRGGIEDLILTGCKIPNLKIFAKLFELALPLRTINIGLAYNDLTFEQVKIVCDWIYKNSGKVLGIDLGYNSLAADESGRSRFQLIIDVMRRIRRAKKPCALKYLSMNTTNMYEGVYEASSDSLLEKSAAKSDVASLKNGSEVYMDNFRSIEASSFIFNLSRLPELRFLDISGNPAYFENNLELFASFLPLFKKLTRLHLEYNQLSPIAVVAISESLISCKNVYYLSLVGNELNNDSYVSICNLLKHSRIFTLDLDYDKVPENFKGHIGVYTMKNMERVIYGRKKFQMGDDEDVENPEYGQLKDTGDTGEYSLGSLAEEILGFFNTYGIDQQYKPEEEEKIKATIFKFLAKAYKIQHQLDDTIQKLIKLRLKHELSIEGKETLIRFSIIDRSLTKVLKILNTRYGEFMREYNEIYGTNHAPNENTSLATVKHIINHKTSNLSRHKSFQLGDFDYDDEDYDEDYPEDHFGEETGQPGSNSFPRKNVDGHNLQDQTVDPNNPIRPLLLDTASRSSSHSDLRKLDQEEGSVMKASSQIIKHLDDNMKDEYIDDVVSQKIKETLLDTTKLGNVISALDDLKSRGIPIESVFKKKVPKDQALDGLNEVGEHCSTGHEPHASDGQETVEESNTATGADRIPESATNDTKGETVDVELMVNQTYDNFVDNLIRVRSRQT